MLSVCLEFRTINRCLDIYFQTLDIIALEAGHQLFLVGNLEEKARNLGSSPGVTTCSAQRETVHTRKIKITR